MPPSNLKNSKILYQTAVEITIMYLPRKIHIRLLGPIKVTFENDFSNKNIKFGPKKEYATFKF